MTCTHIDTRIARDLANHRLVRTYCLDCYGSQTATYPALLPTREG